MAVDPSAFESPFITGVLGTPRPGSKTVRLGVNIVEEGLELVRMTIETTIIPLEAYDPWVHD